jgi:hypothetical protein
MANSYSTHHYGDAPSHRVLIDRDEEHLRLLALFHFVVAGFNLLALLLLVVLPLALGPNYYAALKLPQPPGGLAAIQQRLVGALIVGGLQTLIYAYNGWCMKNHHNRISCMIMSVFECLSIPVGLILGVSAILVLRRDSTKALFESANAKMAPQ